jgi:hypothetical protein
VSAHVAPTFTAMKRCVNQIYVVRTANGKYSECVDDLVASSSATLLAMNDRIAPPQRRSFTPPGREGLPLPAGFLCNRLYALAARLENRRRAEPRHRFSSKEA